MSHGNRRTAGPASVFLGNLGFVGHVRIICVFAPQEGKLTGTERLGPRTGRALVILLFISLTIAAQSSALSAKHEAHHAPGHCCLLCHVGPLPFLRTVAPEKTPV